VVALWLDTVDEVQDFGIWDNHFIDLVRISIDVTREEVRDGKSVCAVESERVVARQDAGAMIAAARRCRY
jgi:hypothetical protein